MIHQMVPLFHVTETGLRVVYLIDKKRGADIQ